MGFIYAIPSSNELYHHGITGQEWGVRHGPPYPLNRETHNRVVSGEGLKVRGSTISKSEPKKIKSKSVASKVADAALSLKTTVQYGKDDEYNRYREISNANATKYTKKDLFEMAKTCVYVPGNVASIAVSALHPLSTPATTWVMNIFGAASLKDSIDTMKDTIKSQAREAKFMSSRKDDKIDENTGLPLKKEDLGQDDDLSKINLGYGDPFASGAYSNCTNCVVAYDLRRRGFDVTAEYAQDGRSSEDYASAYKGGKFNRYTVKSSSIDDHNKLVHRAVKDILSQGDGARGFIEMDYRGHPDWQHVMVYEVKGKTFSLLDGQSNERFDGVDAEETLDYGGTNFGIMRTDNLDVNFDYVKDMRFVR